MVMWALIGIALAAVGLLASISFRLVGIHADLKDLYFRMGEISYNTNNLSAQIERALPDNSGVTNRLESIITDELGYGGVTRQRVSRSDPFEPRDVKHHLSLIDKNITSHLDSIDNTLREIFVASVHRSD